MTVADVLDERHHHTPEERVPGTTRKPSAASRPASHSASPARSAVATGPSRSVTAPTIKLPTTWCTSAVTQTACGSSVRPPAWPRSPGAAPAFPRALFGTFDDEGTQRVQDWIQRIYRNIEDLQQHPGAFPIGNRQAKALAGALGQARSMHIRAAVKQLHKDGKTSCTGTGDVRRLRITPPSMTPGRIQARATIRPHAAHTHLPPMTTTAGPHPHTAARMRATCVSRARAPSALPRARREHAG